ncbi:unnamed protein product [Paramecium primaurelia]|uniref:Uncharacterized protein n=1 Tax=Paramecium primaurelia TaxID=5886 RepID=A0A8S1KS00_PARPR|nr:unnamed protein product [Paramecium primaurelia]
MQQTQQGNNYALCCLKRARIQQASLYNVSLNKAKKRWVQLMGQSQDLISKHNFRRERKFNMAKKEIKQLKNYYNDQLSQILISIDEQLIKNNQNIQDFIKLENKQIFELNEKQVEKKIDLLSQKDKNIHLLEQQEKQNRLDYLFYQNIKSKLKYLIKHDLFCKQKLMKILKEQQENHINQVLIPFPPCHIYK